MALSALIFAFIIGWVALGPGARNAFATSIVDFSQCANDAFPSTATDCPGGWINGILNATNSTYHENEVTPQRLVVSFPSGANHSYDFRYLVRKANGHAYDSLATWNHTVM